MAAAVSIQNHATPCRRRKGHAEEEEEEEEDEYGEALRDQPRNRSEETQRGKEQRYAEEQWYAAEERPTTKEGTDPAGHPTGWTLLSS